ncbi:aldehyde dehydrogenase family protein [Alteromonas sp. ASW11-130]|uniref:aldehyde dehydrogenase family protein n=1 Tax=Alteromonas sp. ASW11-130 TaxID=3015775 RepID=UPI0022424B95|nr:aldehyde dehydrogenase family protein [Alteromonas sp. ASW11-130]MCW8090847.1 aldehyde dehydrogenase family protein [Alteromonas sp. ASW11-130]
MTVSSVPSFQISKAGDIQQSLRSCFFTGKTRALSWRKQQLGQLKKLLDENEKEIFSALASDLGKCQTESWLGEFGFLQNDIKHTLAHLKKWSAPRKVSTPLIAQPGKSYLHAEPLGTVLIIGAWNYPLQLLLAPFIAAIAAGNCAVLKPSELAEATSSLIAKLIPKYMDTDAVQVVEGGKDETTELLAQQWDHIFYTGGEQVGKVVMRAAAEHLTPVTLELGGKSPCIVDGETDLRTTAKRIVWGKWMNAGQTCIAPDYILVEQSLKDALIAELKKVLKKQYGDNPLDNNDYGKIINQRHFLRLVNYLNDAKIVYGGNKNEQQNKLEPTLVEVADDTHPLLQEEIFGPILPIVTVEKIENAIGYINQRPKPLALYLFTKRKEFEHQVLAQTSAGSVCVNDTLMFMTNPELPFGGVGNSGMGNYHGKAGFDTFSHLKSIMKRSFKFDVPVRYAPFKKWKLAVLKKLA